MEIIAGLGLFSNALLNSSKKEENFNKRTYNKKNNKTNEPINNYLNNYVTNLLENNTGLINDKLDIEYKDSIKPNSKIVNDDWRYETYNNKNKKKEINNLLTNDIGMIKNKNYLVNNKIEPMSNLDEQSDSVFSDDYQSFNYKIPQQKHNNYNETSYLSDNQTSYQSDNDTNINMKMLKTQEKFMDDVVSDYSKSDDMSMDEKKKQCNVNFMNKPQKRCDNQFLEQFDQLTFGHNGLPEGFNNVKPAINMWNQEKPTQQTAQSTFNPNEDGRYGVTKDMTHGNMQPNFKSKSYGFDPGMDEKKAEIYTRNVNLFTGSDQNLQFKHKQEVKKLFAPETNKVESVTGTPNFTNFFESRYIPSDKRQNERPFEPIKVTPGLNLGYNQTGSTGRQDLYRVLPKTVDQLRTVTNPKVSYSQPVIPGQKGERRGIVGDLMQKTPDRFFYQTPDSMMPNTGPMEAPAIYGKYLAPQTNRAIDSNTTHLNPAGRDVDWNAPKYLREGEYTAPNKINYLHAGPRNVEYNTKGQIVNKESFENVQTQRSTTEHKTHLVGTVGNHTTVPLINFLNYIPEVTMKQILLEDNGRKNLSNVSNSLKGYLFNSINSIRDPTLRDLITNNIKIVNQKGNHENGYLFNNQNAVTDQNMRNLSQDNLIITTISNAEKGYLFNNLNSIPDPTLRQLVNTLWGSGGLNFNGSFKTNQMFNYKNAIPETTLRELTQNLINITNVTGPSGQIKGYLLNYINSVPDTTLRELTQDKIVLSNINPIQMKDYLLNYINAVPETTLRELTENKKYLIGQKGNYQNNYIFNYENGIPDNTLRNLISEVVQLTNMNGNHKTGYLINYLNSVPDETLKQLTENNVQLLNIRPLQMKNYMINYLNSIPNTTLRELTENQKYITNMSGNHKSVQNFNYENGVPDTTLKETTENQKYITNMSGNHKSVQNFNYENGIPDTTLKEMTEEIKYLTGIVGNHKSTFSYNYENGIPDTTLREHIERTKHLIGIGYKFMEQGKLFNYDDKAKTTLREKTEQMKHLLNVALNKYQSVLFNWDDIPDQTNRAMSENTKNITGVQNQYAYKEYKFNYENGIPEQTNRSMTEKTKNIIGSIGNKQQQRARMDVGNALLNTEKEVIAEGRDPVPVKDNRGPTPFFTEYVFCDDNASKEKPMFSGTKALGTIKNELYFG